MEQYQTKPARPEMQKDTIPKEATPSDLFYRQGQETASHWEGEV